MGSKRIRIELKKLLRAHCNIFFEVSEVGCEVPTRLQSRKYLLDKSRTRETDIRIRGGSVAGRRSFFFAYCFLKYVFLAGRRFTGSPSECHKVYAGVNFHADVCNP